MYKLVAINYLKKKKPFQCLKSQSRVFVPGVFLNTVDGGRANGSFVDADGVPGETAAVRRSVRAGAVRIRVRHCCVVASLVCHVAALAGAPLQVPHTFEENMEM